jgi:hypothetical protein
MKQIKPYSSMAPNTLSQDKISGKENFNMDDLFIVFWWSGPIGLGIFFTGVGILLWGISKIRNK